MTRTTTLFSGLAPFLMGASVLVTMAASPPQQPAVTVHGDDITIRGCVGRAAGSVGGSQPTLVWTRGDIMLMNALFNDGKSSAPNDRVFYWLENEKDLAKHVGQLVEIKGDLGDFKKGEVKFDRDGQYTKVELKLGGKTEKLRMPTAWIATHGEDEIDIVSRKIDVDKISVLGACPTR